MAFSPAHEDLGRRFLMTQSPPALLFVYHSFIFNGDQLVHTNFTLCAMTSPQWLSELGRLWPSVPGRIACELVFLRGSHAMPGQHSQPVPTSLGEGCMCAVTYHLHFWQNNRGLLRATAVTRKWNGHGIRVGIES